MALEPHLSTLNVRVALAERAYDIEVGSHTLSQLGNFVTQREKVTHAVVITDRNVAELHAVPAVESLHAAGVRVDLLAIEPGEAMKSVGSADMLWNSLATIRADRKTIVVAVGGGVIGDLAGFVAASFARGLRFFQVPTTLLSQVDSSVGGKVGVNLPSAKNMVGAFWQPRGVLIDTSTLQTLPDREYRSGLAEVVKYGVIQDAAFFAYLEQNVENILQRDLSTLATIVARCCRLKADVVEQDEREETGLRAILNYGHTYAHAFETVSAYGALLHGEAVSMGMMCAARLALALGRVDAQFVTRQRELLQALQLPLQPPPLDTTKILQAMQQDKKVEHGQLRFVLPSRLGHVELVGGVASDVALVALQGN
jgi:3-dehydroquinate synthase